MKNKKVLPILAVLFSVFVWGISYVSTQSVLSELPPISIAFFRQLIAVIPLLLMMRKSRQRLRVNKKDILMFFIVSTFGMVLYFILENTGLQYTTANSASMLVAAIPVFALLINSALEKTRLPILTLSLILVSIGGVYLVLFEDGVPDFSSKTFLGNMLVLAAMFTWIAYTFLSRRLSSKYNSLLLTTALTICSLIIFLPFLSRDIPAWRIPSTVPMIHLLFLGIFCSAGAFMAYLYGLQKLGPVMPSAFLNLIPVVTILTSLVLLSEIPTLVQLVGMVLIIGSLSVIAWKGSKTAVTEAAIEKNGAKNRKTDSTQAL